MKRIFIVAAVLGVSLPALAVLLVEWNVIAPGPPQVSAATVSTAPAPAQENIRTVTLRVDGLWCPSCSYIVRQALMGTPGVVDAKVSMRAKSVVVTYDPSKTAVTALIAATTNYGFPSRMVDEFTGEVDPASRAPVTSRRAAP